MHCGANTYQASSEYAVASDQPLATYLFVLAYAAAFATYRITLWLGG